jgi:S-DNA-T family DNA segregation ATPase FtsK/SpoIIIE
MAKRRTAKAGAAPKRARPRISDLVIAPVRRFTVNRLLDLLGLGLIALGLACLLALLSHSAKDPSFSVATGRAPANWLGHFGSFTSDFLLSGFGAAATLFVLPWFAWGAWLTFFRHRPEIGRPLWAHGLAWLFGAVFMAMFASALPLPANGRSEGVGVGGLIGDGLLAGVSGWIPAGGTWPHLLVGVLSLMLGTLAFGYAIGFRRADLAAATGAGVRLSLGGAQAVGGSAWRLSRRFLERETFPRLPSFLSRLAPRKPLAAGTDGTPENWDYDFVPEPMVERGPRAPAARVKRPEPPLRTSPRERAEAQPSLDLGDASFRLPELSLLSKGKPIDPGTELSDESLEQNARLLEGVLLDFGVKGEIINVRPGPVVTLYELEPAPGIKSSRVIGLADDIARSMSAVSARVAVVPGRNAIGIELPNRRREVVMLRDILAADAFERGTDRLPLALGKTIGGEPVVVDLSRMPHLLIAGTTGSGKSVAINTMILSLCYRLTPAQVKLILVDPKMLELSVYEGIPHLLAPVVTDPKKAVVALKWVVREMEDRYRKMSKLGVRNITGYNTRMEEARASGETLKRQVQTGFDPETGEPIYEEEVLFLGAMPYIVVVIDEMADLMMVAGKDLEGAVQRLAQMARAAGIHLVMATQRPSVDVITGTIKANFPTRISFQVTSKIDSRTILNEQGAEQLLGAGDMLFMAGGGRIKRVHGPLVTDTDVEKVVEFLKTQGQPEYLEAVTAESEEESEGFDLWEQEGISDELYDRAVAIVARDRKASISYVQRKLQIGYNRAARLMERMEAEGVVSQANHSGKREILAPQHGAA